MKKSKIRGVKIESLKLPSVVDFAVGESIWWVDIQCYLKFSAQTLLFLLFSPSLSPSPYLFLSLSVEPTRSHDWDSVVAAMLVTAQLRLGVYRNVSLVDTPSLPSMWTVGPDQW